MPTAPPPGPGHIQVTLANVDQARHLLAALRGHCEADLLPGGEGNTVVVSSDSAGRGVLRRIDGWLTEFGVDAVTLEHGGRTYRLAKSTQAGG